MTHALPRRHRRRMLLTPLLCALASGALLGCGGGDEPTAVAALSAPSERAAPEQRALATSVRAMSLTTPGVLQAGDASTVPVLLQAAAAMGQLGQASNDPTAGLRLVGATASCSNGFLAAASLTRSTVATPPRGSGVFFNATELATWRQRAQAGPFVADGDYRTGSPGDWQRVQRNAEAFRRQGEALPSGADTGTRARHGQLARDAAFHYLVSGDTASLAAVRSWLAQQVVLPANDFAGTLCFQERSGISRDGWFAEAPWFTRLVVSYDFVRAALPAAERLVIENYLRRQAWFFAAHLDWGLAMLFPRRLHGDYGPKGASAAYAPADAYIQRRSDSNGDCRIDERDDPRSFPVHTHVRADGSPGPRVSELALWFNNRRSANALAAGAAGVLLADSELVHRGKRYVMEWLTYGVYPDGSQGEYERNGDYCIARQGLIYGAMNSQAGTMLARLLARAGDTSLARFETRDGQFGSQSRSGEPAKSLTLVVGTTLKLASGELKWFQHERHLEAQNPRDATSLGRLHIAYMGTQGVDDLHDLALLHAAAMVPSQPVAAVLMRQGSYQGLPWPGASGRPVNTGLGQWSDAFGVLPAAYLLRP